VCIVFKKTLHVTYWMLFPQIKDEIRHCQEEIVKKDRLLSKLSRQVTLLFFSLWLLSAATSDVKLMIHIVVIWLQQFTAFLSSVLWHCWLGGRKCIWPVKAEWWGTGVVVCLEWGANDMCMVQLMPLPPYYLLLPYNLEWFIFLVPAYPGCPGKKAIKRM